MTPSDPVAGPVSVEEAPGVVETAGGTAAVDDYITGFPPEVQAVLQSVRAAMHAAVPDASESISYDIPTLSLDGRALVYFAGWAKHVSVYPVPAGDETLAAELAPYVAGKGTLRFPLRETLPYELVGRVAAGLAAERSGAG